MAQLGAVGGRESFTRRAMPAIENRKAEKAEKDNDVSPYKETGPMGPTDPDSVM